MRLATANIRNTPDMPRPMVVADAKEVGAHADVIFFQEIGEAEDHTDVVKGLGPGWTVEHFDGSPNPIAYRAGVLNVVARGRRVFHGGLAKVSGARMATWVETAEGVVYMNTHFVSGAFNGRQDYAEAWRVAHWHEHYAEMKTLVLGMVAAGKTVVFGGDFNRQTVAKFSPAQVWLLNAERGIDKIAVIPAKGATFKVAGAPAAYDLNSDHHARVIDLTVTTAAHTAPSPALPRGESVDGAIASLRKAKGSGERARRIKAALDALLGIKATRR